MYQIKHLSKKLWARKITYIKRRYYERATKQKCFNHLRRVCETNEIYCNICGKSLKDLIGKDIVINIRVSGGSKWNHISCAIDKNLIDKDILQQNKNKELTN